ncbi:MAG: hypothetical protein ACKPH7_14380 [Planktothrix sp.]|uniref:hypothetical protein n=1 Tax=Planktothrix sp. TaxID=3088171 RepID=UPI0038D3CA6A
MAKLIIPLSNAYIEAACILAKSTYNLEQEYTDKELNDEIIQKHSAYSIGSIINAASYLEATINELFFYVEHRDQGVSVENLREDVADRMKKMWKLIEKNFCT